MSFAFERVCSAPVAPGGDGGFCQQPGHGNFELSHYCNTCEVKYCTKCTAAHAGHDTTSPGQDTLTRVVSAPSANPESAARVQFNDQMAQFRRTTSASSQAAARAIALANGLRRRLSTSIVSSDKTIKDAQSTLKEAGEAIMKWFAGLSGQALDAAILKAFKQFDLDGTGLLDREEFAKAMHAMGLRLTEEELRKLFDSYDIDGNGTIDKNEFAQMVKQYLGKSEDGAVDPAFYVARWHADTTSHSPASTVLQRWVRAALERTKHCKLSRSAINIQKGLRGMRDRRIAKRLQIKADKDGRYTELNLTVEELMASIPLLCKVPTHLRHLLAKNVVYRSYFATDLVVLEGEPADSMFILIKGTAKVIRGKERKEVMRLKAGNFFGENALTEAGQTRHASVRALDTMTCLEIRSDIFQQCVRGGGPMINTGQGGPFLDRAGDAAKGNPGALLANATPPDGHFLRMSSSADCVVAAVKAASHVPEAPPMPGYLKAQNRQQSAGSARVASISREQDVHADEHVTEQGAFSRAASNHAQPNSRTASAGSRRDYMPRMRSADSDTEKVWQTDAPPKEVQYDMGSEQVRPLDLRSLAPAANMKYDDVQNLNPCPSARPALRNAPRRNAHETRQASAPDQDIVSKSARGVMSTREQQGKEQTDGAPQTLARSSSSPGREAPRPHTSDARARVPLFEFSSDFRVVREPPRLPRTRQAPGDSRPVRNGHATGEWPWALAAGGKTANGWIQEAKDNNVWAMANDMMAKQQGDSMAARGPQLTGSLEVEDRRPHSAWVETVSTRHGAGMPAVQRATPRGSTSSRAKLFYGHPKAVARDWARSGAPTAQPQFQRTSSAPGRRPTAFGRHRGFVVEQVDLRSCDLLKESQ